MRKIMQNAASAVAKPASCQTVPPTRPVPSLLDDVRAGLLTPPRSLPPKYFYDDTGSQLFDRICDAPEYYPTRTEAALLAAHAERIMAQVMPRHLVELGSGTSRKTRHLLDALASDHLHATYWPFDVCEAIVKQAASELQQQYPWLEINGLVGDYHAGLDGLPAPKGGRLFVFLGGTIGNFSRAEALDFLRELRACMAPEDWLLLGADRVKDPRVLEAAYNDAAGMTAAFNLNLLAVLNRELQADFVPSAFVHRAFYNETAQQIEMYLLSQTAQTVRLPTLGSELQLAEGEGILTEISRKFTLDDLDQLLAEAGLTLIDHFEPANGYYSLVLGRPTADRD